MNDSDRERRYQRLAHETAAAAIVEARRAEANLAVLHGRLGSLFASDEFRTRVKVATLDTFHGYKNAIDDQLDDADAVLDAFHVVKLGTQAVDEVRRRVQQQIHRRRGRKNDPLYRIRNIVRAGARTT